MARYDAAHKQATRRRIIEAAGRRFKMDGFDGSGVATLMQDAGLTNGAFYAHFQSKDDLITHVITEQLREQSATFSTLASGRAGLEQTVREYLSVEHRDDRRDGCPSAALLDEIGRCGQTAKSAYTDGMMELVDAVAAYLAPDDPESLRVKTLSVFATLIGTLQLSRALADRPLADDLLEQGVQNTLALLGINE